MTDNKDKTAFTFRIDTTAYEKSKLIAKRELRSANSQLEYFIIKGVEQYEKEHGEIPVALDECAKTVLLLGHMLYNGPYNRCLSN